MRIGRKHVKNQCAEQLTTTHQPNQVERTPPRDDTTQGPSIRRPRGNEDVARWGGGECHMLYFRRVLECFRIL